MQFNYAKKYVNFLNNPSKLETLSDSKKINVLKALVCLSKFLGNYQTFKNKLKDFGIKWKHNNSLDVFLKLRNNNHGDLIQWYKKACKVLDPNEALYLEFMLISGLRMSEGINAFNLIIELAKANKLKEYYNEELCTLEHFKYKQFLRSSKNAFISVIPKEFVLQIANSKPVHYTTLRKHLRKHGLKTRIKELRSFYASFMVRHGLIREEADLLEGRISRSIFTRHYLTIDFKQLAKRTLKAIKQLQQTL